MDFYSIETISLMGPVKCPNTSGSVCTCLIISPRYYVVDTVRYGINKEQTESSPSNSSLYKKLIKQSIRELLKQYK